MKPVQGGGVPSQIESHEIREDSEETLQRYLEELDANKKRWAEMGPAEILQMLIRMRGKLVDCADEWAEKDIKNRGREAGTYDAALSYAAGPDSALIQVDRHIAAFQELSQSKHPNRRNKIKLNEFDQATISVFPLSLKDKILFSRIKGELWFKPGFDEKKILESQAHLYTKSSHSGKIALVLGAGNYSALTFGDTLHNLLNDRKVVIIKIHPVVEYSGEFFKKIFSEFIDEGFIRVAFGGAKTGKFIKTHTLVDSIHITGSDKTFDAILFGSGKELQMNKMNQNFKLNKVVTGELGNVTPVIVVPGPWSEKDIDAQAEKILSTIAFNSGFNCNAARVIIQQTEWPKRHDFLNALEKVCGTTQRNKCYYPGGVERLKEAINQYPQAKVIGDFENEKAPWVLALGLDSSNASEFAFKQEIFATFIAETSIPSNSTIEFIDKAVEFCNKTLWGTLCGVILVHPKTLRDKKVRDAIERAIRDLNYGLIAVNSLPTAGHFLGSLAWGGAPGFPLNNIQSGNMFVHNPFMYEGVQKSVIRGPFREAIKSPFIPTNPKMPKVTAKFHEFSKLPTWRNLFKTLFSAL